MDKKALLHIAVAMSLILGGVILLRSTQSRYPWTLEAEETSDFSQIRIKRRGDVRRMLFVRDDGTEVVESSVNMAAPHELLLPYSQAMFASYLYKPQQENVLIVGLGGGAMVHFLRRHDQEVHIDVVEIDPAVVRLAADYFEVAPGATTNILTADGLAYLEETQERYDAIYMDAFLKPSANTDATGVPQRLKTIAFYQSVQEKLNPGGVVAFNLNPHPATQDDIDALREAFPAAHVFDCPGAKNLVVVCTTSDQSPEEEALQAQAAALDKRFAATFSFVEVLRARRPGELAAKRGE